jgi:hypothetical protein
MVPISFAFLVIFMQASYSVILVDPSNREMQWLWIKVEDYYNFMYNKLNFFVTLMHNIHMFNINMTKLHIFV